MKKTIKYFLVAFVILLITIVLYLNYNSNYSNQAIKGEYNITHSKAIIIGMTEGEVLNIMGKPDTIVNDKLTIYCYGINDESYGYGQILFDSTMKVKDKYFPKYQ